MASRALPVLPRLDAMEPERPPPALVTDLLEEIFLRVASPVDLVRASAACVSFRRIITSPSFLRRYRSIHPPLLLGFLSTAGFDEFHPVEATHPSAAMARAVASSFDYLPLRSWYPLDVRDGRVLVYCPAQNDLDQADLAVCDPLSQRHLLLPPITDDLLASVEIQSEDIFRSGGRFIHSGGIEEDTSFGVISWIESKSRLGVFIIYSGSSCWNVSKSISWDDLGLDQIDMMVSSQCVYDCFYWKLYDMSTVIKLDMNSMQFCTVGLPPDCNKREIVIVESGQSKVAMFSVSYQGTSVDYYTFLQNTSEKSHEWHMISTIPLPAHYTFARFIDGPADGCIFIDCIRDGESCRTVFSLEIKSSNIKRVCRMNYFGVAYAYFGFPPSMSPRRI